MRPTAMSISAALALVALVVGGCGGGGDETRAGAPGCEHASPPEPRQVQLSAPKQEVRKGEKLTAVIETSCGTFEIALATGQAPKTVNSFAFLARKGFYDGLDFNRISPNFVVQGGDPLGNRTGGPGYHVDEPPPSNLAYTRGVVAMAKTQAEPPGRSGSQFFVVVVADAGLSPDSALLGRVSRGIGVVERIGKLGTPSGRPKQTVLIERIKIERG
jgi:peptidyl-prolyl cis-trans isomerase B (cyclophilin B)